MAGYILPVLQLLFIALKLIGYISWGWLYVLIPLWIWFILALLLTFIIIVAAAEVPRTKVIHNKLLFRK